ncbi:hypothetical protein ACFLW2_03245 [Chloroflexota bacterium]
MVQRFDVNQFIDSLCERLEDTAFEDYDKESDLLQDVGDVITEYVKATLEEMAHVSVRGQDKGKNNAIWAFGTDFCPAISVGLRGVPTVALEVKLAKRDGNLADAVTAAIGQALLYSVQYSYVIVFILDRTKSDLYKHWFDSEIEARLWDNHEIRLMISQ